MLVKLRTGMLLVSLVTLSLLACNKKDLSPPPLNPHPKEALHVTVTFDNPEDAKRYSVVMKAHYRTMEPGCGYMDYFRAVGGIYVIPEGTFDIPNVGQYSQQPKFDIYLDRYNKEACNWELDFPYLHIIDTYTHRVAVPDWGSNDLTPGRTYHTVCQYQVNDYSQQCYGLLQLKDLPHYSRVPITIHVAESSAPVRRRQGVPLVPAISTDP
ncbi:hypothetical protein [Luteibacter sp. CQ10]|uniref:hypothetical protein n=1 Tax=Luteibacter sp. CQ10 TaxID=2805821 RepID=UPI0034A0F53F